MYFSGPACRAFFLFIPKLFLVLCQPEILYKSKDSTGLFMTYACFYSKTLSLLSWKK